MGVWEHQLHSHQLPTCFLKSITESVYSVHMPWDFQVAIRGYHAAKALTLAHSAESLRHPNVIVLSPILPSYPPFDYLQLLGYLLQLMLKEIERS